MINTVEKIYIEGETNKFCFKLITDSETWFVPNSEDNRHYQEIQEWAAIDGNNIIDNGA